MKTNRLIIGADGNGEGNYTSLRQSINFLFEKNPEHKATDSNSPSHLVHLKGNGGAFEAGAAWTKTVQEGNNRGAKFFSLSLDDPSFDAPLNLLMSPSTLTTPTWRRPLPWRPRPRPRRWARPRPRNPVSPVRKGRRQPPEPRALWRRITENGLS